MSINLSPFIKVLLQAFVMVLNSLIQNMEVK